MKREDKHWTADDELIERFVLNRLNPDERNELEDHLRICEVCKRAVRAEQMLVAGIRRGGREQFKVELRKKVANLPERKTPWAQILSAAAVVVILLTIGMYNRWFEAKKVEQHNTAVLPTPASQSAQNENRVSSGIAEQSSPPKTPGSTSSQQVGGRITNESSKEMGAMKKSAPMASGGASNIEVATPAAPTYIEEGKDRDESQPTLSEREAKLLTDEQGNLWIEGTILSSANDAKNEHVVPRQGQQEAKTNRLKKTDAQPHAGYAARVDMNLKQTVANSSIALSQQNSVALPPTQQQARQQNKSPKVMTRVERIGDKTQMTLFLDSLVDEKDLANATIETPRSDSLILTLSNQRIGYKLPSSWNVQLQQAKPAK